MHFKDHFSAHAAAYTEYRPTYPPALFAWLASIAPRHERAWDCATGNGQAAFGLAAHFDVVVATDASASQIAMAKDHPHIRYSVAPAEVSGLRAQSVDLVTVGQALHWFDFDAFYREVARVLRPDGILAAWGYGLMHIDPAIDALVLRLYDEIVGPFWPPERHYVEEGYRTLPFPLQAIDAPTFSMQTQWNLPQLIGYLGTWSAVQRYRKRHDSDPLLLIADELQQVWGDPQQTRTVTWPLYLRVGKMP